MNCTFSVRVLLSLQYLLNILFISSNLVKFNFCNKTSQAKTSQRLCPGFLSSLRISSQVPSLLLCSDGSSLDWIWLQFLSRDTSNHASCLKEIATHFLMSINRNTVTSKKILCNLVFVPVTSCVDVLICHTSIWWPDRPEFPASLLRSGFVASFLSTWTTLLSYAHREPAQALLI